MQWGKLEPVIPAATGQDFGSGETNTNTIVAFHTAYAGEVAARACADYTVTLGSTTNDEWFLPSKEELTAMFLILGTNPSKPASLSVYNYWSSSEATATFAWYKYCIGGGSDGSNSKALAYKVRPVRSF